MDYHWKKCGTQRKELIEKPEIVQGRGEICQVNLSISIRSPLKCSMSMNPEFIIILIFKNATLPLKIN